MDLEERWREFYLRQSREDQLLLVQITAKRTDAAVEYAQRKARVKILNALGLNGRGECRHCPAPMHCEHGGLTKGGE